MPRSCSDRSRGSASTKFVHNEMEPEMEQHTSKLQISLSARTLLKANESFSSPTVPASHSCWVMRPLSNSECAVPASQLCQVVRAMLHSAPRHCWHHALRCDFPCRASSWPRARRRRRESSDSNKACEQSWCTSVGQLLAGDRDISSCWCNGLHKGANVTCKWLHQSFRKVVRLLRTSSWRGTFCVTSACLCSPCCIYSSVVSTSLLRAQQLSLQHQGAIGFKCNETS